MDWLFRNAGSKNANTATLATFKTVNSRSQVCPQCSGSDSLFEIIDVFGLLKSALKYAEVFMQ